MSIKSILTILLTLIILELSIKSTYSNKEVKMLRELREKAGLTQEELASMVGVQRTQITMIENGKSSPSIKTAKKLAEVLKVHWTVFF